MKNKILLLSLFIASLTNAQINSEAFSEIVGESPTVEINLGKTMLGLLSSATDDDDDVGNILSALSAINVVVFELESSKNIKAIKSKINNIANDKVNSGYEKLATIKEDDSLVYVLANMDDKNLKSLSVIALDDEDELVLIEIQGSILISQIGKLMEHFDVDIDGLKIKNKD